MGELGRQGPADGDAPLRRGGGAEGLRQTVKLLNGEKLEPAITLPTMLITKDDAPEILKKNGLL